MSELATAPPEPTRPLRSRAATRAAWADRITRFSHSGLSPAQFCVREGVSLPCFYSWKRRLAASPLGPAPAPAPAEGPGPRLLPVLLQPPTAHLELVLPGGAVLRIGPGADLALVRSLVLALGGAPC